MAGRCVILKDEVSGIFSHHHSPRHLRRAAHRARPALPGVAGAGVAGAVGATEAEVLAQHPELAPEDLRVCLAFAAARLKPPGHAASGGPEEDSEKWMVSRQSQWLAEQEFLKQLWERNAGPSARGQAPRPSLQK